MTEKINIAEIFQREYSRQPLSTLEAAIDTNFEPPSTIVYFKDNLLGVNLLDCG